jgi:SNF2 family DNA or RNA helicase
VLLELTIEQRRAYDDAWVTRGDREQYEGRTVSNANLFAILSKLKRLCNYEPVSGSSSKLDALSLVVESLSQASDKLIVFSQYVDSLKWLSERLGSIEIDIYHGGLSQSERDEIVSRFERDPGPRILLMSLRAGGLGLNLQAASTVVLFDRWWNPAVEIQAIYRAHRFDRNRPLHVFRYLVCDSVEERIDRILQSKQALFEEYVDNGPSAQPVGLTRDELLSILDIHRTELQ